MIWFRPLLKEANTLCCRCLGWSLEAQADAKAALHILPPSSAPLPSAAGLKDWKDHRESKAHSCTYLTGGSWGSTFHEKQASLLQRHFPQMCRFPGEHQHRLKKPWQSWITSGPCRTGSPARVHLPPSVFPCVSSGMPPEITAFLKLKVLIKTLPLVCMDI